MTAPASEPIGLQLTRTAKVVSRAFDAALAEAGGSLPQWLILVSLKGRSHAAQRDVARAVGVEGPTLTHHLNRMETDGLVTRSRDPQNRRVHRVELTRAGEAAFRRLLGAVVAFDRELRAGFTDQEIFVLGSLLTRMRANVGDPAPQEGDGGDEGEEAGAVGDANSASEAADTRTLRKPQARQPRQTKGTRP